MYSKLIDLVWQRHRIECANNVRYEAEISQADEASTFPLYALQSHLPTFGDMDEMLRRWVKFHDFVLMAAAVHALDLMQDFSRSRTHTLWLQLSHRCFNHEEPSKYFRIANAEVVAISDVTRMGKDEEWIKTLNMFSSMSYKSEIEGKGLVAAVIVECPPLAPQIMPVGSPAEHRLKPEVLANWKEILIKCVERGEKVLHFGV